MPRRCENVYEDPRSPRHYLRCERDVILHGKFCTYCEKVRAGLFESKTKPTQQPPDEVLQRLLEEWDLV
jgi:hypothetical protein